MLYVAGHLKYPAYFHDTFVQLATDTHEDVRAVIAAQIAEVLSVLADLCAQERLWGEMVLGDEDTQR